MERNGFETVCLDCGSTDVSVLEDTDEDIDEDIDGEYYSLGSYFQCNDCGQRD